jgi:DNA-directed RNA polymerase subunit M/transcription elongation factor TFIIS
MSKDLLQIAIRHVAAARRIVESQEHLLSELQRDGHYTMPSTLQSFFISTEIRSSFLRRSLRRPRRTDVAALTDRKRKANLRIEGRMEDDEGTGKTAGPAAPEQCSLCGGRLRVWLLLDSPLSEDQPLRVYRCETCNHFEWASD